MAPDDKKEKTTFKDIIIRGAITSVCFIAIFWYGSNTSVLFSDIVATFASIPLLVVLAVELVDKIADKKSWLERLSEIVDTKKNKSTQYLIMFGGALIIYFAALWALTGTLTLGLGADSPALKIVAGLLALYVVAPETGSVEFILWAWVASQIVTQFQHFTIM